MEGDEMDRWEARRSKGHLYLTEMMGLDRVDESLTQNAYGGSSEFPQLTIGGEHSRHSPCKELLITTKRWRVEVEEGQRLGGLH
jgi:hypothetical protein